MTIRLIVGLGNPGSEYEHTRHNVGALFVRALAARFAITLQADKKARGDLGRGLVAKQDVRLLVPSTWMNDSGASVGAVAQFYKLEPAEIMLCFDEMAFNPGLVRFKTGGGDNGHNGIRSVVAALGKRKDFHRLRIGVGHPGDKSRVTRYLTSVKMPESERRLVDAATDLSEETLRYLLTDEYQLAMNILHAEAADGI